MKFFDRLRTEKLLSFTLIVFTLAIGVVIGTLISTGVKAARPNTGSFAPDATPLTIPNAVELPSQFTQIAKQVEPSVVSISTTYMPKVTQNPHQRRRQVQPDEGDQGQGQGQGQEMGRVKAPVTGRVKGLEMGLEMGQGSGQVPVQGHRSRKELGQS